MTRRAPIEAPPADPTTGPRAVLTPDLTDSPFFDLYLRLVGCELTIINHFMTDDRVHLVAESRDGRPSIRERLTQRERDVFCRILAGQSQKATAHELGLSTSTVATHASRGFAKLNVPSDPCSVPLALVLIAQAACGAIVIRDFRVTTNSRQGRRYVVANLPRPACGRLAKLTNAERAVAQALVDGSSKGDIARDRSTSIHTIGRQISGIFSKLNVKGRFELILRMNE